MAVSWLKRVLPSVSHNGCNTLPLPSPPPSCPISECMIKNLFLQRSLRHILPMHHKGTCKVVGYACINTCMHGHINARTWQMSDWMDHKAKKRRMRVLIMSMRMSVTLWSVNALPMNLLQCSSSSDVEGTWEALGINVGVRVLKFLFWVGDSVGKRLGDRVGGVGERVVGASVAAPDRYHFRGRGGNTVKR